MTEIKVLQNEETGEAIWVLHVGDLKFHCSSKKEAEHLEMMLLLEKNREILALLQGQWEEDILEALIKQNLIFKAMILALLGVQVIWGAGLASQFVWQAVDFCEALHNIIHQPAVPAPAPRM